MYLKSAIRDHDRNKSAENSIQEGQTLANNLTYAEFQFRFLNEGQALANFLAEACPNPRLAVVGIAEIFINAVEHGNLGISYEEKSTLHSHDNWLQEVEKRLMMPEHKNKLVKVKFERQKDTIKLTIKDEGKGFDWKKFQQLDASRVYDNHGRGIVMAKSLAFQSLQYLGNGNEVECVISLTGESE